MKNDKQTTKQENKRWTRIDEISPLDEHTLNTVVSKTKGMSRYGNRARCSVMLPVEIAKTVSSLSKRENKTVNEIIVELIKMIV